MADTQQTGRGMGNLMSRFMLAMRAGLSFGSARDTYKVFGYPRKIDHQMLRDRVMRQDVVKTCLYRPAEAIWTQPPQITGPEEFVRAWELIVRKHKLWSVMLRADKMLGIEPYVSLFLGVPGDPSKPATKGNKDLSYIQPFGASVASISYLDNNILSPRFGRPTGYALQTPGVTSNGNIFTDWSRVVHITNELTDENNYSAPRILAAYNLFDDILKVTGGSAETFWLTANRGMQVDVDKEMELDEDDANALSDELDEFQHQLRRYIRTRGVKITNLGSDVADPRGTFEVLIGLLAGTYGIPQRVMMGSEAGQLASEQDRANWATVVNARRVSVAEPYMLIPLIEGLQRVGALPETEEFGFIWPEAFHLSPLERAQTMAQSARAIVNLSRQAQYGTPIVSEEEAREIVNLPSEIETGQTMPKAPVKDTSGNAQLGGTKTSKTETAGDRVTANTEEVK